jgi:hypothetical protein
MQRGRLRASAATVALIAAAVPLLGAAPAASATRAAAGTGPLPVRFTASNWYYDDPYKQGANAGAPAMKTPTTVPMLDLAVGYQSGAPATGLPVAAPVPTPAAEADKVAVLGFDLSGAGVSKATKVASFTVTIPIDAASDPMTMAAVGAPPALVACLPQRAWAPAAPGTTPSDYAARPPTTCAVMAAGVPATDGSTYTFDVTALAQRWVSDVNTGLEILPAPSVTAPFQLSIGDLNKVTFTATGSTPDAAPTPAPAASTAAANLAPASTGRVTPGATASAKASTKASASPRVAASAARSTAATSAPTAGTLPAAAPPAAAPPGAVDPPAALPPVAAGSAAPVAATAVDAAVAPAVAPGALAAPASAQAIVPRAATSPLHVRSGIGLFGWVFAVLLGLLALGALSLALGGDQAAAESRRRASRLSDVLAGAPASTTPFAPAPRSSRTAPSSQEI